LTNDQSASILFARKARNRDSVSEDEGLDDCALRISIWTIELLV
jgi:hypothetical protein